MSMPPITKRNVPIKSIRASFIIHVIHLVEPGSSSNGLAPSTRLRSKKKHRTMARATHGMLYFGQHRSLSVPRNPYLIANTQRKLAVTRKPPMTGPIQKPRAYKQNAADCWILFVSSEDESNMIIRTALLIIRMLFFTRSNTYCQQTCSSNTSDSSADQKHCHVDSSCTEGATDKEE